MYLEATQQQNIAFYQMPIHTPLQMLNLLKFVEKTADGITGEAQYKAYMKAALPYFQQSGAKIVFYGTPKFTLIGPTELEWDKVLIVEYASKQDFLDMVMQEKYPSHLRKVALADSRLIFCEAVSSKSLSNAI